MRTDYKKYYAKPKEEIEEIVVTTVEDVPEERDLLGTVTAEALYVREAPRSDAEPITTVKKGDDLLITVPSNITEKPEWYKVCTSSGVEGYSMGKFIEIV